MVSANGVSLTTNSSQESASLGDELVDAADWTSDGWTGDFAAGFTHTAGNTSPLSRPLTATGTNRYYITFTVHNGSSGTLVTVTIGNSSPFDLYIGNSATENQAHGIVSVSDGDLVFMPDSTFNGRISDISVKKVTAARAPISTLKDSLGSITLANYASPSTRHNIYFGVDAGKMDVSCYGNVILSPDGFSDAMSAYWCVGIGDGVLTKMAYGSRCVAVGFNALNSGVGAMRCNAIGSFSQVRVTTGLRNDSHGSDSLFYCTTGSDNATFGFASGYNITTGSNNVGFGNHSIGGLTTESNCVGIGVWAGQYATADYQIYLDNRGRGSAALQQAYSPLFVQTASQTSFADQAITFNGASFTINTRVAGGVFRVSGLSADNSLYLDAPGKKLGINCVPLAALHVCVHTDEGTPALSTTTSAIFQRNSGTAANNYISIIAGTTGIAALTFGDKDAQEAGYVRYYNATNTFTLSRSVGFGVVSPVASVDIIAGSTAKAPLKFAAGVNLTTALSGAIEYDGTHLFFTDSAPARKTILATSAYTATAPSPTGYVSVVIGGITYNLLAATA